MAARSRSHVARLLPTGCRPVNRTTRPIERRVVRSGALPGPGRLDTAVSSLRNQHEPAMTDPCDRSDLVSVEKANASLAWISDWIVPSPRGARPAARPTAAEQYPGNDVTPAVGPTAPSRAHSGATIAKISASTALELSVAASSRPVSSRLARSRAFGWRSTGSHRPSAAPGRWGSTAMSGCPNSQRGLPGSRSRSVIPLAGKLLGDEPAASDESADARARGRAEQTFLRAGSHKRPQSGVQS